MCMGCKSILNNFFLNKAVALLRTGAKEKQKKIKLKKRVNHHTKNKCY